MTDSFLETRTDSFLGAKFHVLSAFYLAGREKKIMSCLLAAGRASNETRHDFYLAGREKKIMSCLLAGSRDSNETRHDFWLRKIMSCLNAPMHKNYRKPLENEVFEPIPGRPGDKT